LAFINYYTYKLMLNSSDTTFQRLLKNEISEFYANTDVCYDLIGDPSTILKSSYNAVEEAYALIFSDLDIPASERYSIRNTKYLLQEDLFKKTISGLSELINIHLNEMADEVFTNIKTFKLAFTLSYIFLNLIFAFFIKCWMLEEILRNSKKSKSMVAMLPPWLIERNKGIS